MTGDLECRVSDIALAPGLTWCAGWFALCRLDPGTLAIGEPAYHQKTWCYLLRDGEEALLFDTGSGRRPIAPVLARHAPPRVRAFPSHMHFDHLGGAEAAGPLLVADLPCLRAAERDGRLIPPETMHLGHYEGVAPPVLRVAGRARPGDFLRIGARRVQVLHTPGHSPDSVSLWEPARARLYAADLIYPGELYAHTPGASLPEYLDSLEYLLDLLPEEVEILGAHGVTEGGADDVPRLGRADLVGLHDAVAALLETAPRDGACPVNARMTLLHSAESFTASPGRHGP